MATDSKMLLAHFNAVERALEAMKNISGNAGHNIHIGTPREWLLRNFLGQHLPSVFEIGAGEIISVASTVKEKRNQIDLVVHRREHPQLDYGGGISAFLIESVAATIEVKSSLNYTEFRKASIAARNIKSLKKAIIPGAALLDAAPPPTPVSYLIAYSGPSSFDEVYRWILRLRAEEGFVAPILPPERKARTQVQWLGLDAVFVLGKGYIYFDSTPFSWLPDDVRAANPNITWLWTARDGKRPLRNESNLLFFFLLLNTMISGGIYDQIDAAEYLKGVVHLC
jgi:hypothetical protein